MFATFQNWLIEGKPKISHQEVPPKDTESSNDLIETISDLPTFSNINEHSDDGFDVLFQNSDSDFDMW